MSGPTVAPHGAYHEGEDDKRGISRESAPRRIIWLESDPYIATEPTESTMCRIENGKAVHESSVMVSRVERPATVQEVEEWRVRR